MASIRRTLSPVPRAGAVRNPDTHSLPSPLSKSSYAHNPSHSPILSYVDPQPFLYKIQSLLLGIFSKRSSRSSSDRSKSKGPLWRKAFFQLFVCFMLGVFTGLTPVVSNNLFINPVSNRRTTFLFEGTPPEGNTNSYNESSTDIPEPLKVPVQENYTDLEMQTISTQVVMNGIPNTTGAEKQIDPELPHRKLLIIVTPTYVRPFQAYYLHRLAHTLRLVSVPLLWIVVEMSSQSTETADILRRTGVMYRHLVCDKNLTSIKDKNVHQRNVALSHIEKHRLDGIVYFADDNNVYSIDLFEQLREIRRFGVWPFAMLTENKKKAILEGPVCNGGQVNGWSTSERIGKLRRFHADMSCFAFNSTILWDPKRWHRPTQEPIRQLDGVREGLRASMYIEQVVEDESQMEGLLNCSKIMVWHLPLEALQPFYPQRWLLKKNLDVVATLI